MFLEPLALPVVARLAPPPAVAPPPAPGRDAAPAPAGGLVCAGAELAQPMFRIADAFQFVVITTY